MGKRFFQYVDDYGTAYAIELDEDNVELVNAPAATNPALVPANALSRFTVPRTLRYNSSDGLYSRKVIFLSNTPQALAAAPLLVQFPTKDGDIPMQLTAYIGERQRIVPGSDTRQTDGDLEVYAATP